MKIVVVSQQGAYYFKPDNTLNHNNSDYYCPAGVSSLEAIACAYTHIDKAGKCVAERFADRYYSKFAFGCLLVDRSEGAVPEVSAAMDFTSVMDMFWLPLDSLAEGGYSLVVNGEERFRMQEGADKKIFSDAICAITKRASLRIGDIIAIELGSASEVKPGDSLTMTSHAKSSTIKIF